jgi:putative transposase
MRKSPKVTRSVDLYLRGLSTEDFASALAGFFGSEAGLSVSTVQRLTCEAKGLMGRMVAWQAEHETWAARDLCDVGYVYVWADGADVNFWLPEANGVQDRLCLLVIVGVRPDGRNELISVADGHRDDTQSWIGLVRDLRDRGMAAPELTVADGAPRFRLRTAGNVGRLQRAFV